MHFQFSLWDSLFFQKARLKNLSKTFNSLCEILFLVSQAFGTLFALLSILFVRFRLRCHFPRLQADSPFNSLCEIQLQPKTQGFFAETLLSILFVRFLIPRIGYSSIFSNPRTFNSLCEILCPLHLLTWICVYRTFNSLCEIHVDVVFLYEWGDQQSFNSLCEIQKRDEGERWSHIQLFQFSLWDS